MKALLHRISSCQICKEHLPLGANPVLQASSQAKIMIIGQAPGAKVHKTGIPWDDASGNLLRNWLGIDKDVFYDAQKLALIPMGFCYPGKGKSGDLPPRPECAAEWHKKLITGMPNIVLTILIGQYAQRYYLGDNIKNNLTATVTNYRDYLPQFLPLPHPSPRNRFWLKKNPWFEQEIIPILQETVKKHL